MPKEGSTPQAQDKQHTKGPRLSTQHRPKTCSTPQAREIHHTQAKGFRQSSRHSTGCNAHGTGAPGTQNRMHPSTNTHTVREHNTWADQLTHADTIGFTQQNRIYPRQEVWQILHHQPESQEVCNHQEPHSARSPSDSTQRAAGSKWLKTKR